MVEYTMLEGALIITLFFLMLYSVTFLLVKVLDRIFELNELLGWTFSILVVIGCILALREMGLR